MSLIENRGMPLKEFSLPIPIGDCSICLDPMQPGEELIYHLKRGIRHPFHKNCLLRAARVALIRFNCPFCRMEIDINRRVARPLNIRDMANDALNGSARGGVLSLGVNAQFFIFVMMCDAVREENANLQLIGQIAGLALGLLTVFLLSAYVTMKFFPTTQKQFIETGSAYLVGMVVCCLSNQNANVELMTVIFASCLGSIMSGIKQRSDEVLAQRRIAIE